MAYYELRINCPNGRSQKLTETHRDSQTLRFVHKRSEQFKKLADVKNIYNCTYYVVHQNRPKNNKNNISLKIYTYTTIITMDAADDRAKLRSRLGVRRELSVSRYTMMMRSFTPSFIVYEGTSDMLAKISYSGIFLSYHSLFPHSEMGDGCWISTPFQTNIYFPLCSVLVSLFDTMTYYYNLLSTSQLRYSV